MLVWRSAKGQAEALQARKAHPYLDLASVPVRTASGTPGWEGRHRLTCQVACGLPEEKNLVRMQF